MSLASSKRSKRIARRDRIIATFKTVQGIAPLGLGVAVLHLSDERFAALGYGVFDRELFGAAFVTLGLLGYGFRWQIDDHPVRWSLFVSLQALAPLAVAGGLALDRSWIAAWWALWIWLSSGQYIESHRLVTTFFAALQSGVLRVSRKQSPYAPALKQIADGRTTLSN